MSLTHSYFNLSGNAKNNVFDHELQIAADKILDVDKALIPTGEYCAVDTTLSILEQQNQLVRII